jgi:hypothetical protein
MMRLFLAKRDEGTGGRRGLLIGEVHDLILFINYYYYYLFRPWTRNVARDGELRNARLILAGNPRRKCENNIVSSLWLSD